MEIIEKITIKHYRSLVNTGNEISELGNLNIFSGSNDSGKSNILRALNIFFNGESEDILNFYSDFSIQELEREERQKIRLNNPKHSIHKNIDITLHFNIRNTTYRTQKFAVTKRFNEGGFVKRIDHIYKPIKIDYSYTKDFTNAEELFKNLVLEENKTSSRQTHQIDLHSDSDKLGDKGKLVRTSITKTLNRMRFYYIPAIKDGNIFSKLYSEVLSKIKENNDIFSNKEISDSIKTLESLINNEANALFTNLDFLKSAFKIPDKLEDFFSTFDIGTQKDKEFSTLSLKNRGDGLQARYIPELMDFISKIESDGNRIGRNYFWGFEEPENSYEYLQAKILAEKFRDTYSKDKQIFITSHSFNFLSLEGDKISKYRVYKDDDNISRVFNLKYTDDFNNNHKEKLDDEIGLYKLNIDLDKLYKEKEKEKELLQESKKKLEEKISSLPNPLPNKIFICEDSKIESINLWKKLLNDIGLNDIEILSSGGSSNSIIENWIQTNIEVNKTYKPLIFRQIDRDGLTDEQKEKLEEKMNTKYKKLGDGYKFLTLNVNELENYAILNDTYFTDIFFDNIKQDIEDIFEGVSETKCDQLNRFFDFKEEDLFKNKKSNRHKMRDYARTDWKKLFPGKDICKNRPNFNGITYLSSLNFDNLPQELKDYLEEIKTFFN